MVFFGYSSEPELSREAIYNAVRELDTVADLSVTSWEDLFVDGRVIIDSITDKIDASRCCAFDISTLNSNVLFELGYAIARKKQIWLLLEQGDSQSKENWSQFGLLADVSYVLWDNSQTIKSKYLASRPDQYTGSFFEREIEPHLDVHMSGSLFYAPSFHYTESVRVIDRRLELERHRGIHIITADPRESPIYSIDWFASKIYGSDATVLHFEAPRRDASNFHNARSALIGGLARGLERPLLMLAEEDYSPPLDYRNMLRTYRNASECESILDSWIRDQELKPHGGSRTPKIRLATELRTLRFGEHVAENEMENLPDYFVRTSAFEDVIADRQALFIGRKGTGKTANMLQAAATLTEDARNLVVVIKPAAYEFSSLLAVLTNLPISQQAYSIEALWRFLLVSEITSRVVEHLHSRPVYLSYTEEEAKLLQYAETVAFDLKSEFGVRFEQAVNSLTDLPSHSQSESDSRDYLNEALHTQAIQKLRALLGPVLKGKQRIALLIDNLDKGWEKTADIDLLSQLLLGLLSAVGRVKQDFEREDSWRERISLTVTVFLRSDIFAILHARAREPDKLPVAVVDWEDEDTLLRIIEERFLSARPEGTDPDELWTRFFCAEIDGLTTREYLVRRVLPRPRDLIFLCNAAVNSAVNRGSAGVEVADLRSAEMKYSQFAFESLLVEDGITIDAFQNILFEFISESSIVEETRVRELILRSGITNEAVDNVVSRLKSVSFFGIEVDAGKFEYPEVGALSDRAEAMSKKYRKEITAPLRFEIHPAYRPYLGIQSAPPFIPPTVPTTEN